MSFTRLLQIFLCQGKYEIIDFFFSIGIQNSSKGFG